jgi:hypothetical protein
VEGAAAANAATGAASHTGASVASWSSNHRSSSCQPEQQPSIGEAAVHRSSSPRQEQQPSAGAASAVEAAVDSRISSSSLLQEQQPLAGAAAAVAGEALACSTTAAATAAVRQKAKVAALERRASARALTLARSRGSEAAECLRSPEPTLP